MGKLKYLMIHCTATPEGREVTKADIIRWHTSAKSKGGRGWSKAGYSDVIYLDGSLHNITPFNQDDIVDPWELTYGARGFNGITRHFVYVGGTEKNNVRKAKDTRTDFQKEALEAYVRYMILRHPDIQVLGHNQVAAKACPSFDVPIWLCSIGISEKHIYKSK